MGRWFLVLPGPYVSISYLGLMCLLLVLESVLKVPLMGLIRRLFFGAPVSGPVYLYLLPG